MDIFCKHPIVIFFFYMEGDIFAFVGEINWQYVKQYYYWIGLLFALQECRLVSNVFLNSKLKFTLYLL